MRKTHVRVVDETHEDESLGYNRFRKRLKVMGSFGEVNEREKGDSRKIFGDIIYK